MKTLNITKFIALLSLGHTAIYQNKQKKTKKVNKILWIKVWMKQNKVSFKINQLINKKLVKVKYFDLKAIMVDSWAQDDNIDNIAIFKVFKIFMTKLCYGN